MKKADDDGKDEACGRDHQDVDEDEEDQLDQCPHAHLPQGPLLELSPARNNEGHTVLKGGEHTVH